MLVLAYLYGSALPRHNRTAFQAGIDYPNLQDWPSVAFDSRTEPQATVSPLSCSIYETLHLDTDCLSALQNRGPEGTIVLNSSLLVNRLLGAVDSTYARIDMSFWVSGKLMCALVTPSFFNSSSR